MSEDVGTPILERRFLGLASALWLSAIVVCIALVAYLEVV